MSNSKRVNTVTAIAALGAVAITGAAAGVLSSKKLSAATPISAPPNATLDRNLPASFSAIIDRVGPAVVSIRVTSKVPRAPRFPKYRNRSNVSSATSSGSVIRVKDRRSAGRRYGAWVPVSL